MSPDHINGIKLFADTANPTHIDDCFKKSIGDGITTNPKIMEASGGLSKDFTFEIASKALLMKYPDVPVSIETHLDGVDAQYVHDHPDEVRNYLLKQAREIASWGDNVVVKIPICQGGLEATAILAEEGIKTNVTACMSPYQAIEAAKANATYASLFANRMLDSRVLEFAGYVLAETLKREDWKSLRDKALQEQEGLLEKAWDRVLRDISFVANEFRLDNYKTELIVGSIRSPKDIQRLADAAPQIITIPYNIAIQLTNIGDLKSTNSFSTPPVARSTDWPNGSIKHPMTNLTLEEFEQAANCYRKPKGRLV